MNRKADLFYYFLRLCILFVSFCGSGLACFGVEYAFILGVFFFTFGWFVFLVDYLFILYYFFNWCVCFLGSVRCFFLIGGFVFLDGLDYMSGWCICLCCYSFETLACVFRQCCILSMSGGAFFGIIVCQVWSLFIG